MPNTSGGNVNFGPSNLAAGLVPSKSGYDQFWMFGFSAPGVEAVRMLKVELASPNRVGSSAADFVIDLPFEWSWVSGDVLSSIDRDGELRAGLIAFLKKLHATLDAAPAADWAPYFEAKVADLAKATGTPIDQVRADQQKFFGGLVAMDGWGLEPFDASRLVIRPVGEKIVAVR